MGIQQMIVGGRYLAGDSYGYDIVDCLEVMPQYEVDDCVIGYAVKIAYCKKQDGAIVRTGETDVWFECAGSGFSTYVEPYMES